MINAFVTKIGLRNSSRLPSLAGDTGISTVEIACLLGCGLLSMFAVGFMHLSLRLPGHAILRGVLPMAMGLALVPRRSSGIVMAVGAGLTAAAMNAAHVGRFPPAAVLSVLALGPILDLAIATTSQGWRLYVRFALAGALANLLAFAVRFAMAWFGWELAGSRQFTDFWLFALFSFVLCGVLAGLVSAAVWFRLRPDAA